MEPKGRLRAAFARRPHSLKSGRFSARIRACKNLADRAKTPPHVRRCPNFGAYERAEQKKSRKSVLCATVRSLASCFRTVCLISAPTATSAKGRTRSFIEPSASDRYVREVDGRCRRRAAIAGRNRERRKWADSDRWPNSRNRADSDRSPNGQETGRTSSLCWQPCKARSRSLTARCPLTAPITPRPEPYVGKPTYRSLRGAQ